MRDMTGGPRPVLFIIPELVCGGAERTFVNVLNRLDRDRFKPVLALYRRGGPFLGLLKEDVAIHSIDCDRARFVAPRLARLIRAVDPAAVLSTLPYPNAMAVLSGMISGKRVPVLVRETNHRTAAGISRASLKERVVGWSYRRATRVIALSEGVRSDLITRHSIPEANVVTIHNPIDIESVKALAQRPVSDPGLMAAEPGLFKLVSVGVLKYQKGYDLLLQAIARLKHIPLRLWLVGDGAERDGLVALSKRLGIDDRVVFAGFQENPYAWMARSDLFVLSSRWEGFGHVIAEAMACGVPVLATRCRSGPEEIITDGTDGRLCRPCNVEDLAASIAKLWKDRQQRERLAAAAPESARRFDVGRIVRRYEDLLEDVVGRA